jgi:hypothetical protein
VSLRPFSYHSPDEKQRGESTKSRTAAKESRALDIGLRATYPNSAAKATTHRFRRVFLKALGGRAFARAASSVASPPPKLAQHGAFVHLACPCEKKCGASEERRSNEQPRSFGYAAFKTSAAFVFAETMLFASFPPGKWVDRQSYFFIVRIG